MLLWYADILRLLSSNDKYSQNESITYTSICVDFLINYRTKSEYEIQVPLPFPLFVYTAM